MCVFLISPVPIAEPLTSELIDTPVFYNLAPRPIKYRVKSLVGDRPSWHKEPINFLNKMLSIRKVRLLITSRYIAMQSYECLIISKMIDVLHATLSFPSV